MPEFHTSPEGIALITRFEGFAPRPYFCPAGKRTVGYGHTLLPGEAFAFPLTQDDALALLRHDLVAVDASLNRLISARLAQHQHDALASFVFNVGAGAFARSALRRCVNQARHADAQRQFHRWVYAGGRKLPGLVARRKAEAELYGR